jgi:hypothetical protein
VPKARKLSSHHKTNRGVAAEAQSRSVPRLVFTKLAGFLSVNKLGIFDIELISKPFGDTKYPSIGSPVNEGDVEIFSSHHRRYVAFASPFLATFAAMQGASVPLMRPLRRTKPAV